LGKVHKLECVNKMFTPSSGWMIPVDMPKTEIQG